MRAGLVLAETRIVFCGWLGKQRPCSLGEGQALSARSRLSLLKQNGVIATYSSDAQPEPKIPFLPLLLLGATIRLVDVFAMPREAHEQAVEATTRGLREGWLKSTIASRFSLDQILDAPEATESGKTVGEVVIPID